MSHLPSLRPPAQRPSALAIPLVLAFALAACGPDYPRCRTDDQCHEGEFCVDGQCQQCRSNADCADGSECVSGGCRPRPAAECASDADCAAGSSCVRGSCVASSSPDTTSEPSAPTGPRCGPSAVYFGFDEASLTGESRSTLTDGARCITGERIGSVSLTGMTDPRGTEEYNLTLGERRAQAVRDYLGRLGVSRDAMRVRSVGEEMSQGTDEAGFARDRRVEIEPR